MYDMHTEKRNNCESVEQNTEIQNKSTNNTTYSGCPNYINMNNSNARVHYI